MSVFRNYINTFRIGKAQDYLKNTNMKIYEIAHILGYNSVSYFNTAFRKVTGVTPAQYRNKHRIDSDRYPELP